MFGLATWAKLGLVIFSLGGVAGGSYVFGSDFLKKEGGSIQEKSASIQQGDDHSERTEQGSVSEVSSGNSDSSVGKDTLKEEKSEEKQLTEKVEGDSSNTSLTTNAENSIPSVTDPKEVKGDLENRGANHEVGEESKSITLTRIQESTVTTQNNPESKELHETTSTDNNDNLSSENERNEGISVQGDDPQASARTYLSGRENTGYSFEEGITGEVIFPKNSVEENSEEKICLKIENGSGIEQPNCENFHSENSKIWVKVKEKEHVKKIFEKLTITSRNDKWFEGEEKNTLDVEFFYKTFTCTLTKKPENNSESKEFIVSCAEKSN
ncbi:hypothetical protein [Mycoplasma suis]|uniref:Uncharacterized protein n=1 Tax=Mycoplasma suis (strain Illinois) TaxID=768700 RepID=F0QQ77_MYCSL|nr:hypothetical protein [Mycoplasma suis]ADX97647.1 hypothetical protein MSU_0103 [Mycoplasma suis str. Illinois]